MTEPKALPRDHPDYRHPAAVAPPETIMDADDMATMRDKLRAGHTVVVGPTGHLQISAEPTGPPMTPEAEAFIESRLGEVRRLALQGVSTRIRPDGDMAGSGDSGQVQHAMSPDRAFTQDEWAMVENAILAGARVSIRPDGSIFTAQFPNDRPTTLEERQDRLVRFNEMRAKGDLDAFLDQGEAVQLIGDKIVHGVPPTPLPPPIEFPEPEGSGSDAGESDDGPRPVPTAAELAAEAGRLTEQAAALRKGGDEQVYNEVVKLGLERDEVARQKYGAEQQAAASDMQEKRERRVADEQRKVAETAQQEGRALEAKGDHVAAAEKFELAQQAKTLSEAASFRAVAARDAGIKLRQQADDLGRKLEDYDSAVARAADRGVTVDDAADGLEERARHLQSAAHNLSEADRLTTEAAKARADGDDEAARLIENAAKYHRTLADEDWAKAEEFPVGSFDHLDDPVDPRPVRLPPPIFGANDPLLGDSEVAAAHTAADDLVGDIVHDDALPADEIAAAVPVADGDPAGETAAGAADVEVDVAVADAALDDGFDDGFDDVGLSPDPALVDAEVGVADGSVEAGVADAEPEALAFEDPQETEATAWLDEPAPPAEGEVDAALDDGPVG